jgi:2-succinyl-5-enolpyruvyl-6-hydroxy-3-cyclohexene-1-carboxylate synthase
LNASNIHKKDLSPDLLITAGKMVLNKTIKQLLREHPPQQHWHIAENGFSADTFFTGPRILKVKPAAFFKEFKKSLTDLDQDYFNYFERLSEAQERNAAPLLANGFNGLTAVKNILRQLPDQLSMSLANSMTVRYVAYLASYLKPGWKLYSNRGVSGIDGCSSTAVGMAMVSSDLHILVTGDIAFYYDINALWQQHLPENFRIILLNDFGGGIFRNIDGPADLPELDPYIGTPHQFKADHMAAHFGIRHYTATSETELGIYLPIFLEGPGTAILEIITDQNINSNIFKQYKSLVL